MKNELARLQGTWNIVALEVEGQKMAAGALTGSKIVVKGDRFTTLAMGATYEGKLEVDPAKTPKTFNLNFTAGPEKGNTSLGIYELDGDTWKICMTVAGNNRPKEFATKPRSGHAFETLKRDTGAGSQPSASEKQTQPAPDLGNLRLEPAPELEGEWAMVSGAMDGHPIEKQLIGQGKRVVKGNDTTAYFGNQIYLQAKFTVDRTKEPKTIDYFLLGSGQGQTQHGIYELKGKKLMLCFAPPGQERPTDFASKRGDGRTFTVWSLTKK